MQLFHKQHFALIQWAGFFEERPVRSPRVGKSRFQAGGILYEHSPEDDKEQSIRKKSWICSRSPTTHQKIV